jgi:polyribonucleotide nucleotidyltransferase
MLRAISTSAIRRIRPRVGRSRGQFFKINQPAGGISETATTVEGTRGLSTFINRDEWTEEVDINELLLRSGNGTLEGDGGADFIKQVIDGPPTRFGAGAIANLTESSIVGTSGKTVVLSTVAIDKEASTIRSLSQALTSLSSAMVPLSVTYQERHHGVGRIPQNGARRDALRATDDEILAGRAIDRALRPLLTNIKHDIHLHCSVQAYDVFGSESGHPVALALNSASLALKPYMKEPVAAINVCLMKNGTVVVDPQPYQVEASSAELLFAGTRDKVIMMEFHSPTEAHGLSNQSVVDLMRVAHAAIQPLLDTQQSFLQLKNEEPSDSVLRKSLGLPEVDETHETAPEDVEGVLMDQATMLMNEATAFCEQRLGVTPLLLFGYQDETERRIETNAIIHPSYDALLSKSARGRREHMVYSAIEKLVSEEFMPAKADLAEVYQDALDRNTDITSTIANEVRSRMLRKTFFTTATTHGTRGDNRGEYGCGHKTVRPLSVTVPALPDIVHGSALFSRGETQVLCTATLGAPTDGLPKRNPFQETKDPRSSVFQGGGPYDHLPVGSLRYIRSQEALVSDFNSRKVKADKEQTGDSGTLEEKKRIFLHYDFPAFCKGELPKSLNAANRRAIGHGRLAEKAILPAMPPPSIFPYAVRLTCEVTGSNGSSSMASVCGATLALLDAGVPILAPVAAVSVGVVSDATSGDYGLLLDITGTEDHYGDMDFKVAGTETGVTAFQLDVKKPLSMDILEHALHLAWEGRIVMLHEMEVLTRQSSCGVLSNLMPRTVLKDSAPRVEVVRFDPLRKRDLIGPGGAVIRQLEDRYGVSLDLTQEGQCLLFGANPEMVKEAKASIMDLVADVEEGGVYTCTVIEIKDFGAILEALRNKEGLLHVSEISDDDDDGGKNPDGNYGFVRDHLKVGQKIEVLCTGVDPVQNSIRFSRKKLLQQRKAAATSRPSSVEY